MDTLTIDPAVRMVGSITWAEAIDRIESGETTTAVATVAGVSRQRIAQIYAEERGEARLGVYRKEQYRADLFPRIVRSFEESPRSIESIADDLGTTSNMVSEALNGAGYRWPDRVDMYPVKPNEKPIDLDQAFALYNAGESFEEIGRILGVSTMTAHRHLVDAGIKSRKVGTYDRRSAGVSPYIDDARAAKMYADGESSPMIARELGVPAMTVYRSLKRSGVDMRHPGTLPMVIDVDTAVERYTGGESLKAIAEDFGVAVGTIRKNLLAAGVKMRSTHRLRSVD